MEVYRDTGKELLEKLAKILIKVDKIGDEMKLSFVNDSLKKGKAVFFDPIKKFNLDIGFKKIKKIPKAVSVMKEDRQAFGVILRGRSETKRGVSVHCYISDIKLSISRFDR